ncbi:MAG: hypothetical protein IBX68_12275 [Dehalococcoidia bacterium]|nr:hypothetical protein [Dehalococcoidia bacterium]
MDFEKPTRRDVIRSVAFSILFSLLTAISGVFLVRYSWPAGLIIWGVASLAGMLFLVRWHAGRFGYRCRECEYDFEISTFTDLISFQGPGDGGWKYLKCPRCGRRSRAIVLKKVR